MGKNARRRKEARRGGPVPKKPTQSADRQAAMADAFASFTGRGATVPGSLFRRSCDECGSTDIAWMHPLELAPLVDEAERGRIAEGIEFLGGSTEAWRCGNCGNWGLMGQTEAGGF